MTNKQKTIIIVSVCLVVAAVVGTVCILSKQSKKKAETTTEQVTEGGSVEDIQGNSDLYAIEGTTEPVSKVDDIIIKDKNINSSMVDFGTVGVTSGTRVAQSRKFTTKPAKTN